MKTGVIKEKRRKKALKSGASVDIKERFSENIKYLLWSDKDLPREEWVSRLVEWSKGDTIRAKELLYGAEPSSSEQKNIAEAVNLTESDLRHARLLEEDRVNILRENILYLLESLEHGEQGKLAKSIGVDEDTITKWKSGQGIRPKNLEALREYFRMSSDVDLKAKPIFLELTPFGDKRRREWLHNHIAQLEPDTLRDLFPSLVRQLREP